MRFRSALVLAALALVVAVLGATLGAVVLVLNRAARQDAERDLLQTRRVFEELLALRRSLHRSEARVVAEEPRLKAAVGTREITAETVLGVAQELRRAIGSDLFLVTDTAGRVLADVEDTSASGASMASNEVVAGALRHGAAGGVWIDAEHAYEVEALRLGFDHSPAGVLVLGYRLDTRLALQVSSQTGSGLLIELDGRLLGWSLPGDLGDGPSAQGATRALARGGPPATLDLGGVAAMGQRFAVPGYRGAAALTYTLVGSLEAALEPKRWVEVLVIIIGGAALLLAVVFASLLARGLSRPVDELVAFTRAVGSEDPARLAHRTQPRGPRELVALGQALNRMVEELAASRDSLVRKQKLEGELEIAERIQTSILPRSIQVPGLEVAATMRPTDEVGGDYYDVQPTTDGCWIGIGDVAGHGLTAGLVMMMTQSAVAALVRARPTASPGELVSALNRVIFDNVHRRLAQREHMTLSLLRYRRDGSVSFAGAHEDILVCRASGKSELIETPGTWIGAIEDISAFSNEYQLQLGDGDVMVLYSDGVTQAGGDGGLFGVERLCAEVERLHRRPAQEICDQLIEAVLRWSPIPRDDVTVMVLRYQAADQRGGDV